MSNSVSPMVEVSAAHEKRNMPGASISPKVRGCRSNIGPDSGGFLYFPYLGVIGSSRVSTACVDSISPLLGVAGESKSKHKRPPAYFPYSRGFREMRESRRRRLPYFPIIGVAERRRSIF
jgi:hypothetical protein